MIQVFLLAIYAVCFFATASLLVVLYVRYHKVKNYFWNSLSEKDKEYINYGGVRPVVDQGISFKLCFWLKKEWEFQKKRNEILLMADRAKGESFIALERKIVNYAYVNLLFLLLTFLSLQHYAKHI